MKRCVAKRDNKAVNQGGFEKLRSKYNENYN